MHTIHVWERMNGAFLPIVGSDIAIKLKTDDVERSLQMYQLKLNIFFPGVAPVFESKRDGFSGTKCATAKTDTMSTETSFPLNTYSNSVHKIDFRKWLCITQFTI